MANKKPCYLYMAGQTERYHSVGGAKYAFEQAVKAGRATAAIVHLIGAEKHHARLSVGPRGAVVVTKVKP